MGLSDDILGTGGEQKNDPLSPSQFIMGTATARQNGAARMSAKVGAGIEPDRAARVVRAQKSLEQTQGIDAGFIERNLEPIEQRIEAEAKFDPERMNRRAPVTTQWIAESPVHFAAVKGGLDDLAGIERNLSIINGLRSVDAEANRKLWDQHLEEQQARDRNTFQAGDPMNTSASERFWNGLRNSLIQMVPNFQSGVIADLKDTARDNNNTAGAAGFTGSIVGGTIPNFVAMAVPAISAPLLAGQALSAYQSKFDETHDPYSAVGAGVASYVSEKIGLDIVGKLGAKSMNQIGKAVMQRQFGTAAKAMLSAGGVMVSEGLENNLQTGIEQSWDALLGRQTVAQGAQNFVNQAPEDFIGGAIGGGMLVAPAMLSRRGRISLRMGLRGKDDPSRRTAEQTVADIKDADAAMQTSDSLKSIGDIFANSNVSRSSPESVNEVVSRIVDQGDVKVLYQPIKTWKEYWRTKGINPREKAAVVLGDTVQYDQADAAGHDFPIPMEKYIENIASTEHNLFFADEVRAAPDSMNRREAIEFHQSMQDSVEKDSQQQAETPDAAAIEQARARTANELLVAYDGKLSQGEAETLANLAVRMDENLARRAGKTFGEFSQQFVRRIAGQTITSRPQGFTGAEIERQLVDWAKASDVPIMAEDVLPKDETGNPIDMSGMTEFVGKLPTELLDAIEGKPHLRRVLNVVDRGSKAGGEDAIAKLGVDRYVKFLEAAAGGSAQEVRTALAAAHDSPDPTAQLLRKMHELIAMTRDEARTTKEMINPDMLPVGSVFTVQGTEFSITADEFGQKLIVGDGIEVPTFASESIPVDVGSIVVDGAKVFDQGARGRITMTRQGQTLDAMIQILKNADRSTAIHELGHNYLEILGDLVKEPGTSAELKSDYQTLLNWFGVNSSEEIGTAQHEQFARGFEAYLFEGKAPVEELVKPFARFKAWMMAVYKSLTELNVTLTPEVRGVFDRLVASEAELDHARNRSNSGLMFLTAESAGMTPEEWAKHQDKITAARAEAEASLQARLMDEIKQERMSLYTAEKDTITDAVTKEADAKPEYVAMQTLRRGVLPGTGIKQADGTEIPAVRVKLSTTDLVRRFGKESLNTLRFMHAKDGMNIDDAAQMLGFGSGEEMVGKLQGLPSKSAFIASEVERRLTEMFPSMLDTGAITDAANEAIQNEKQTELLAAEMQALLAKVRQEATAAGENSGAAWEKLSAEEKAKQTAKQNAATLMRVPKLKDIRAIAKSILESKTIRDIVPNTYLMAIRKAGKEAIDAVAKGDYQAAAEAKQRELLNHELYRQALGVQKDAEQKSGYIASFAKPSKQMSIGKAGGDWLDQVNGILERVDVKPASGAEVERRQSLMKWVAEKEANGETLGEDFDVPDSLIEQASKKNLRDMTIGELTEIHDFMKRIDRFSSLKNKLIANEKERNFDEARDELTAAIDETFPSKGPRSMSDSSMTRLEKIGKTARGFNVALLKLEAVCTVLDDGKIDGPWHRHLWNPLVDATNKQKLLGEEYTRKLQKIVDSSPDEIRKTLYDKVRIDGIEREMNRKEIISAVLNMGNESNMERLRAENGNNFTDSQMRQMLDTLTKPEMDMVQSMWDVLKDMFPKIDELTKFVKGIGLDPVEVQPLTTRHGVYDGGYFPVVYDPVLSETGDIQQNARVGSLGNANNIRATTFTGHTKERKGVAGPVMLDFDVLPSHIDSVIHDLAFRKWSLDANKIIADSQIRAKIAQNMGKEYVEFFKDRIAYVINDRNLTSARSMNSWNKSFDGLRVNLTISALGFNFATMLTQQADIAPAIAMVGGRDGVVNGARWFGEGYMDFLANPMGMYRDITTKSTEMAFRLETRDRQLREKFNEIAGKNTLWTSIQRFSMHGIGVSEMMVSLPAWQGAYLKALHSGLSEELAIHSADAAVRLTHGSGDAKDLSSIHGKNDNFWKSATMFYSPASAMYNQYWMIGHQFAKDKDVARTLGQLFFTWLIPAAIGTILTGSIGPDDRKGESWSGWVARSVALHPAQTIPVVRDMAGAFLGGRSYDISPMAQSLRSVVNTLKVGEQYAHGDKRLEDVASNAFHTAKPMIGIPSKQFEVTGDYWLDVLRDRERPGTLGEFLHKTVYRRDKNDNPD